MRRACAILAILFALGACSKAGGGGAGGRNPWTLAGTLRIGNSDEPDNLNPLFAHTDATDQVDGLIFSSLLRYDGDGNFIPDLATEVPSYANGGISRDGKTIVVHLRKGVQWSDGAALTSRDWLFTYHAVNNPRNNTKLRYGWDDIASAQAPNDRTIVIRLKQPNATVLGLLAFGGAAYPPLPAHLLERLPDINRASFNNAPISSGPYLLQQWNHGASLIFTPNPRYFRGKPRLQKIVWKVVPDGNTLFAQLQTHEVDVISGVNENDIKRLAGVAGITVTKKLVANWRHLYFNMRNPLLRDVRVRLAIAESIDWKRLNQTVYHGYNVLATSDIFPQSWAAPKIPPYPYDPGNARRLLAAAGWTMGPGGFLRKGSVPMQLTISTGTNKQENIQAEIQIQGRLRDLGFDIAIRNYPVSLLFAQNGPIYTGKYDMGWTVEINAPDPDNSGSWNSIFIPPAGTNVVFLDDPVVDRTSLRALHTFDQATRKALYQQEEERIHALVPSVFFYWENSYTAANSDLKNFKPASFVQDTWNAWQWQI